MFKRLSIFAAAAVMAVTLSACGYNTIPTQDEQVKNAWSEVQNQYQRRADLIPNLVRTVEAAGLQERGTLTEVMEARARATQVTVDASTISDPEKFAEFQAAQGALDRPLGRLMATVENYPQLQTNQNFLALQAQLEGTENRISIARRDYNTTATTYNTTLRTFPGVVWAKTLHGGQKPAVLFQATAGADQAPTVNFPAITGGAAASQ